MNLNVWETFTDQEREERIHALATPSLGGGVPWWHTDGKQIVEKKKRSKPSAKVLQEWADDLLARKRVCVNCGRKHHHKGKVCPRCSRRGHALFNARSRSKGCLDCATTDRRAAAVEEPQT